MSYPVEEYQPNNNNNNHRQIVDRNDNDLMRSFFGLANRMMGGMLNNRLDGVSASNPNVKVFGISSMNVTQISRGPDGRPRVVQAHDERRMGPNGLWQTKKALRDPDRGIDKMQVGYFLGDQGQIIERHRDPTTGQYRQEVKRRNLPDNQPNFANKWRSTAQQAMQRPLPDYNQQALPAYDQQVLPPYDQYPQEQQSLTYDQYPQQQQALPYNQDPYSNTQYY